MAPPRLAARVPGARFVGVYELSKHALRFHKIGKDGSAKCDAFHTGDETDRVQGVIYSLDPAEIAFLDKAEDLGKGYEKRSVQVLNATEQGINAFAYFALRIDVNLRPYAWYKHHVLAGARYAGLPPSYVQDIERVPAVKDPDPIREHREMAVHRGSFAAKST